MAKVKRLSRVARECNVGIHTIVDFLAKKGFEIENSPNSKVPEDALALVMEAFQHDLTAKKEAERFTQEHRQEMRATISLSEAEKEADSPAEVEPEEVLLIKDASVPSEQEAEKPVAEVVAEVSSDAPEVEEKPQAQASDEAPDTVAIEEPKAEGPTLVDKVDLDKPKAKKEKQAEPEQTTEEKSEIIEEPKPEKKEEPAPAPVEDKAKEEDKKAEESVTETPESETKSDKPKPKVVGKIDIEAMNQKTRPAKKKKEDPAKAEKKAQAERTKAAPKAAEKKKAAEPKKDPVKKEEVKKEEVKQEEEKKVPAGKGSERTIKESDEVDIKTKVEKLSGPTVVGKIELPVAPPKKKTPAASSSDDPAKKKKRKRIRKDRVNVKGQDGRQGGAGGQTPPAHKGKPKPKRKTTKPEVSEEDVQKQIKDTLARLTSKGKSKGSKHRRSKREAIRATAEEEAMQKELDQQMIKVTEFVTANELANLLSVPVNNIIATCMNLGLFVSINQRLDAETISLVVEEYGHQVEFISIEVQESIEIAEDTDDELTPRPPIVTVMGHVDHGKTSLLDFIRHANVIAGEAGGITQHIGAYKVHLDDKRVITFLDTPGHEAFTAMRARGAQVTDIAIIVVSADDAVMPQTVEAINHASAAGVPIVFAINKIDKEGANPEKIKEELANMNYLVEEWGGKYQSHDISAKQGKGIDELLEKVLLEAELLELQANANKPATGSVIESSLDKGRGYVTTILVQSGTLKMGDIILAGSYFGRVKAMFNERGKPVENAGPAEPVLILGLNGAPQAGDKFNILTSEREAREISTKREQLQREQEIRTQKHITLDEIGRRIAIGNFQELNIIVKGDVDGSIEALSDSLIKLSTEEIQVNVKHKAVGQISESDVLLAAASDAIIIGFQVRPSLSARKLAEKEGVDIRLYSIIYDAINELKDAMEGMLSPEIKEEINGTLEILETFKITKVGTVAGCMVRDGKIYRNSKVRVIREGIVVYDGNLGSLKRFKDDVKEVVTGLECGLNIENFNDIKDGDVIEAYTEREIKKKL